MVDLNVSNLQVGKDGRVSFSGLGSGIDFEAAVDGIIAAKRIPIDRLEAKIDTNKSKIAALGVTRTLLTSVQQSLTSLHGAVSFDSSGNLFASKQAFASAARSDGASPSSPANIIGVSVTASASAGSHTIELLQTAEAHRVGSSEFTSISTDLGTARGLAANSISGTIEIAGKSITVQSGDSLNDLADRINNANTGDAPTGVTASIVSTSATENFLVLTVDSTGKTLGSDVALADPDNILEALGVLDDGGGFANELQQAAKARFHADGLLDSRSHSSDPQANAATPLGLAGTLTFKDTSGGTIGTLAYGAGDTLADIADAIANDITLAAAGVSAGITTSGGESTLAITGSSAFNLTDSGALKTSLGIAKDPLVIERDSNTISDLFDGVTLTLFQAEVGTTISIDVERDLSAVKTGIVNFVNAYNGLRQELNRQLNTDPETGEIPEDAVLFGNSALKQIDRRLEEIVGSGADGISGAFAVLAQIGVDFVANGEQEDATLRDTLEIDEAALDEALLNNPDDVKKLFEFSFSSSDPRVVLLGFNGSTTHKSGGYTMDIDYDEGGGALNSVAMSEGGGTVNGQGITVTSGGAKGLKLFYSGDTDLTGVQLNFTVGVGAKLFFDLGDMLDQTNGLIATEVNNLTTQNTTAEDRTTAMIERLDRQRESQLARFIKMETALATMKQLLEQITQITDAMFQDR